MTINLIQYDARTADGQVAPFQFVVRDAERSLTFGVFTVKHYSSPGEARLAAEACKAKHEATPWVSPFVVHQKILLADYGGACKLANLALSLYNGRAFPFDAGSLGGLDEEHLEIAIELIRSYHQFGENDKDFLFVCEEIKGTRQIGVAQDETEAA